MALDNLSVAALQLVNDIAEKHGLRPYQFVARTIHKDDGAWIVRFESPPDPGATRGFQKMMRALGMADNQMDLEGSEREIWDRLVAARSQFRSR